MNSLFCPYCNKELIILATNTGSNRVISKCENHKLIHVRIVRDINFNRIEIWNNNYIVSITDRKEMRIWQRPSYNIIATLSIDPNLTPENFEKKIKTYLTFL